MLEQIRKARTEDDGFTLVELLIVIVILGILASIVVFSIQGINDNGTASACKSDKKNVEIASEAYFAKTKGSYATAIDGAATTTLVGSKLLREAPGNDGYTINYNAANGVVTATGC